MSSSLLGKSLASINQQSSNQVPKPGGAWKHDMHSTNQAEPDQPPPERQQRPQRELNGGTFTSNRLFIENLHYEVSERELQLLFLQIGPISQGPSIKFDTSGRSTGMATVAYEKEAHAIAAKNAFDGALAKGEKITVKFDARPPPLGRPAPGTLLARLEPTQSSQSSTKSQRKSNAGPYESAVAARRTSGGVVGNWDPNDNASRAPRGGAAAPRTSIGRADRGVGNTERGGRGGARGGRGGRGGGRGGDRDRPEAKTSDQLDSELEAFMSSSAVVVPAVEAAAPDVNMA